MHKDNPAQDWTELATNDPVIIAEPGRERRRATIDAKTPDSTVVWVIYKDRSRRAFDHREGIRLIPLTLM